MEPIIIISLKGRELVNIVPPIVSRCYWHRKPPFTHQSNILLRICNQKICNSFPNPKPIQQLLNCCPSDLIDSPVPLITEFRNVHVEIVTSSVLMAVAIAKPLRNMGVFNRSRNLLRGLILHQTKRLG